MIKKIFKIFLNVLFIFLVLLVFGILALIETDTPLSSLNLGPANPLKEKVEVYYNEVFPESMLETAKKAELPPAEGFKKQTFEWEYAGKKYNLELDLYSSYFYFYQNQPKTFQYRGELPENWEEEFYGLFLLAAEGDNTLDHLAEALKNIGEENKFSDDQVVELTTAFVQGLDYDQEKAARILVKGNLDLVKDNDNQPRYPYEVLWEEKGVCSDKSFLLVSLLRRLGYGAAILEYEAEQHMAVGIQCPEEYAIKGTTYCYVETTSVGHKVGIIPLINEEGEATAVGKTASYFDEESAERALHKPSEAVLYQETKGKEYTWIKNTINDIKAIDNASLEMDRAGKELAEIKEKIDEYDQELGQLYEKMEKYKEKEDYDKYNEIVDEYNELVGKYKKKVKEYNEKVKVFNNLVNKYNNQVEEFYK